MQINFVQICTKMPFFGQNRTNSRLKIVILAKNLAKNRALFTTFSQEKSLFFKASSVFWLKG